jgi:hypothetical protein
MNLAVELILGATIINANFLHKKIIEEDYISSERIMSGVIPWAQQREWSTF